MSHSAVASNFTPGNNIVLTRIEAEAMNAPEACSVNMVLQISDGTPAGTQGLVISNAENDSGSLALNYAAGVSLRVTVIPASGCHDDPGSINVVLQYQGR